MCDWVLLGDLLVVLWVVWLLNRRVTDLDKRVENYWRGNLQGGSNTTHMMNGLHSRIVALEQKLDAPIKLARELELRRERAKEIRRLKKTFTKKKGKR